MENNSTTKTPVVKATEKVPEKAPRLSFECLGSFRMFRIREASWNSKQSLFTTGSGILNVIAFYKELNLAKSISARDVNIDDHKEEKHKILFRRGIQNLGEELSSKSWNGYCCIFEDNFFSLTGNFFYPLSLFSPSKHGIECVLDVPADRVDRFNLLFDLIFSLSESSTENKTILIASYLIVILQESKMLNEKFQAGNFNGRKSSAEIITDKFKILISRYYLCEHLVSRYGEMLFISANHLNKIVKSTTGRTASELISERILADAKTMLHQSTLNVSEIAYYLGFEDASYFTRLFKKKTGVTPLRYRAM